MPLAHSLSCKHCSPSSRMAVGSHTRGSSRNGDVGSLAPHTSLAPHEPSVQPMQSPPKNVWTQLPVEQPIVSSHGEPSGAGAGTIGVNASQPVVLFAPICASTAWPLPCFVSSNRTPRYLPWIGSLNVIGAQLEVGI